MYTWRDAEFTEYMAARLSSLRRLAYLLCRDWNRADDLVQRAIIKLYVHWSRARAVATPTPTPGSSWSASSSASRRSGWARRVRLDAEPPDVPAAATDHDAALDVRSALAGLPPRQRATLVLRFYCDLSVEQSARALGCSAGTVKSQTAKGI
jgi:RNA polymerase sigma factor (sigma-70 family)